MGYSGVYKYLLTSLAAFSPQRLQNISHQPPPTVHIILFFCTYFISTHHLPLVPSPFLCSVNVASAMTLMSHSKKRDCTTGTWQFIGKDTARLIKYTDHVGRKTRGNYKIKSKKKKQWNLHLQWTVEVVSSTFIIITYLLAAFLCVYVCVCNGENISSSIIITEGWFKAYRANPWSTWEIL